jgi:hypothetical protein
MRPEASPLACLVPTPCWAFSLHTFTHVEYTHTHIRTTHTLHCTALHRSCSRAIFAGALLGAAEGWTAIPEPWLRKSTHAGTATAAMADLVG